MEDEGEQEGEGEGSDDSPCIPAIRRRSLSMLTGSPKSTVIDVDNDDDDDDDEPGSLIYSRRAHVHAQVARPLPS